MNTTTRVNWILATMLAVLAMTVPVRAQQPFPAVPASRTANAPPHVPTFVTRQTTFAIPFSVDRRLRAPVEVHLYVSRDAGHTWRLYARQLPAAQRFLFTATGDGDYWFASRTIAANNPADAQQTLQAEMEIIVDSIEPECEFTVRAGQRGEAIATWELSDPHLDTNSLKIEYRPDASEPWLPVPVPPAAATAGRDHLRGHVTWVPETQRPTINVRAEASDRAGNRVVVNRRLLLPALASQPRAGEPALPTRSVPSTSYARLDSPGVGAVPWPRDNSPHAGLNEFISNSTPARTAGAPPARTVMLDQSPHGSASDSQPTPPPPTARLPRVAATGTPSDPLPRPSANARHADSANYPAHYPVTGTHDGASDHVSVVEVGKQHARDQVTTEPVALGSGVDNVPDFQQPAPMPTSDGPVISPVSSDSGGLLSAAGQLPPGARPQMTNSPRFQLDYDIDAVGPSGVAEVQLWATEDGGQTWRLWGTDDDRQSPFDVQVEREGILGFRVVIIGRNGLAGPKPRSGDPADIWVGVDKTSPVAQLVSATYGEGTRAGRLIIRWSAEDLNLERRPITLLFSESPDGPWTIIASSLPNDGEYAWPADPQLPPRVYLRLEARDQAGNVGTDQTDQAIRIDGLAPKARIRGLMRTQPMDREAFHQPQRR